MKLLMLLEVDVSDTIAETMQRNGFVLSPDGSGFQIRVPNAPAVPQRKTHVAFVENPERGLKLLVKEYEQAEQLANSK